MSAKWAGFALILDSLEVSADLPFEILPDHWFRKAEKQEIDRIKKELLSHKYAYMRYEYDFEKQRKDPSTVEQLAPDAWRYFVVSFYKPNHKLMEIQYSLNLLKDDINLGYAFFNKVPGIPGEGVGLSPNTDIYFIDNMLPGIDQTKFLSQFELNEITTNYELITSLDVKLYPNILRAVKDFQQTKLITNISAVKILSYFSIIESLLTHHPKPSDTIDSITRQIKTKMFLLSKRFQRTFNYKIYFPSLSNLENVWEILYNFRSRLAHGEEIEFQKKFSALVSNEIIRLFLV